MKRSYPYEARILRGAALLDEERPGWRGHIDLHNLDMGYSPYCVLGQEFGGYYTAKTALGIDTRACINYGFQLSSHYRPTFARLTAAWRRYLAPEKPADA